MKAPAVAGDLQNPQGQWVEEGLGTLKVVKNEHSVPRHRLIMLKEASTTGGHKLVLLNQFVDWRLELQPAQSMDDQPNRAFVFEGDDVHHRELRAQQLAVGQGPPPRVAAASHHPLQPPPKPLPL
jgi:hypothetical protein